MARTSARVRRVARRAAGARGGAAAAIARGTTLFFVFLCVAIGSREGGEAGRR